MLTDQLDEVLRRAHAGHRYIKDSAQYRVPEHWTVGLKGDCEDFALWCRQELAKLGIESDLVFCITETNEGHLVCSVNGWILDNRFRWLMRRDDLDYTWVSIGKPDGRWFKIK